MKKMFPLVISFALLLTCGVENRGTNDETSTRTGAVVYEQDGKTPAAGATVKVFKADGTDGKWEMRQTTDQNGRYSLEGLAKGTYTVWAEKDSMVTFQDSVYVSEGATTIKDDTLECPSTVTGVVGVQPPHDPRTVTIQVVGSDKFFNNTDSTGHFTLKGMAAGNYSLLLTSTLTEYTPMVREIKVDKCRSDTLKDTIGLIYTGIPVVVGIKAAYDTLNGLVTLSWNKTGYRNLQSYMIYRDFFDSVNLSAKPVASRDDTVFIDTIFKHEVPSGTFSFSDSSDYHFKYRVCIRNNSGELGLPYKGIAVVAASPLKIKAKLQFSIYHIAKERKTDSASINDSLLYSVQVVNVTRALRRIEWTDIEKGSVVSVIKLDSTIKTANDTAKYVWLQIGTKALECKVTDMAGDVWRDTCRVDIVTDLPQIKITTNDSLVSVLDTIKLHFSAIDKFGRIMKWELDAGNSGEFKEISANDTSIIAPDAPMQSYSWIIRATDDDGNVAKDSFSFPINLFALATGSAAFSPRCDQASVVFDNKMWVIGGSVDTTGYSIANDVWYSTDGIIWTQAVAHATFPKKYFLSVAFDDKMWLCPINPMDGDTVKSTFYSTDGKIWVEKQITGQAPMHISSYVAYNNEIWAFQSDRIGIAFKSSDGGLWEEVQQYDAAKPFYQFNPKSIVFDNKIWACGSAPQNLFYYSSNGISWTKVGDYFYRAGFSLTNDNNKMWMISGIGYSITGLPDTTSSVLLSTDGITWQSLSPIGGMGFRHNHTTLFYDNKIWVIGGITGLENRKYKNDVWYSRMTN